MASIISRELKAGCKGLARYRVFGLWTLETAQLSEHASELVTHCYITENIQPNQVKLHSDNGHPMKGATMLKTLQELGVMPSFSRPSVSDDNPYSESLFKTTKYCAFYPEKKFETIESARDWVEKFVCWYNTKHRHSGIRYVTPEQRHSHRDTFILQAREQVYAKAKEQYPHRWARTTRNWQPVSSNLMCDNYLNKLRIVNLTAYIKGHYDP